MAGFKRVGLTAGLCKAHQERRQTMAEGDKDHGGIPVTPAIGLGDIDQPIDLGAGQGAPWSDRPSLVFVSAS
jgi:hypothetical protein